MSLRNTSKSSTKKTYPGASYNKKTNNNKSEEPFVLVKKTDISLKEGFEKDNIEKFIKRLNMLSFNIITSYYIKGTEGLNKSTKAITSLEDLNNYNGEYKKMRDTDYFIWKNTNEKAIILVTAKIIIKDGKSALKKDGYYFVLISNYGNIPNINDNNVI